MDDIAIGGTRLDHAGAQKDHSAGFSAGMRPDLVVTAATRPFGVRVIGARSGTSVVTTEWFDTVQRRAEWIAQAQDVTVDLRPLIRLTDHDEVGTFLGGREVASLQVLAQEAREEARQAGLRHADLELRIATAELRAVLPTATAIVADLASALVGEGNPFVEEVRDATGNAIWTQDYTECTHIIDTDVVDRVAEHLSVGLDYADASAVGWEPFTDAQLAAWAGTTTLWGEYYSLTLPTTPRSGAAAH
ncbi:hypothetical protein [Actinophytocola sp.]|uniref:hypothetical protein n=1 Tax=Actinophytocola sp. TaxID=1872138 RepID=UPI00389B24D7